MSRNLLWSAFGLLVLVLAACGGSATPAAPSGTVGSVVQTDGGSYTNLTPQELKAMLEHKDFVFVNTHIPYEGELEGTDAFVPYDALAENLGKLPSDKNAKIVLYCRSGRMSTSAAQELVKKGFTNVYNLDGGWEGWKAAGFPFVNK